MELNFTIPEKLEHTKRHNLKTLKSANIAWLPEALWHLRMRASAAYGL
jgi:hypothetical protein